ncbi:MAG: cell division ATPase MinD [Candidatus Nanoarchaeia archaeon]|nr:cell division ATPase MinD [Candidatus Nanoarchaeia archaeon]
MTRFIGIISGKGGVGKTTTSINLGAALTYFGKNTVVIDANLTTPNIGIHLGVPIVPINLNHVLQGKNTMNEAMYEHPCGTKIIPASISLYDLKKTNPDNLKKHIRSLDNKSDIVLVDCAAGLGREALMALDAVDELLIVTNPELPAITDALKTIKLAEEMKKDIIGVILTKTKENNLDVSINNVQAILEKPVISSIPDSKAVREALTLKDAVVFTHPKSEPAVNYKKLASNLIGKNYEEEMPRGFFSKLFSKKGQ